MDYMNPASVVSAAADLGYNLANRSFHRGHGVTV
jgi:hypothetical protein